MIYKKTVRRPRKRGERTVTISLCSATYLFTWNFVLPVAK